MSTVFYLLSSSYIQYFPSHWSSNPLPFQILTLTFQSLSLEEFSGSFHFHVAIPMYLLHNFTSCGILHRSQSSSFISFYFLIILSSFLSLYQIKEQLRPIDELIKPWPQNVNVLARSLLKRRQNIICYFSASRLNDFISLTPVMGLMVAIHH